MRGNAGLSRPSTADRQAELRVAADRATAALSLPVVAQPSHLSRIRPGSGS